MIRSKMCGMKLTTGLMLERTQLMVMSCLEETRPFLHDPLIITDACYERLVALFVGS